MVIVSVLSGGQILDSIPHLRRGHNRIAPQRARAAHLPDQGQRPAIARVCAEGMVAGHRGDAGGDRWVGDVKEEEEEEEEEVDQLENAEGSLGQQEIRIREAPNSSDLFDYV